jgi:tellurite resistance protein TerC
MVSEEVIPFILFTALIVTLLLLDLVVLQRRSHSIGMKEASLLSVMWIALAMCFNVFIYFMYHHQWFGAGTFGGMHLSGSDAALQFLAGYLVEESLSVDNIFVFVVIFTYFGVPARYQHKVLFWGILGAIIMRFAFIVTGSVLIARFEWILYIFGVILVVSGWKMMTQGEMEVHPEKNLFIRLVRKWFPVSEGYEPPRFFLRKEGKLWVTPLFIVLITVETTDVVFAVDSIPAVFGITRDPFIVYSSNMFAILGLRSIYFVLAGMMKSFHYLKYGLSLILIFIGVKMLIADFFHIPIVASLVVLASILAISVTASIVRNRRQVKGGSDV